MQTPPLPPQTLRSLVLLLRVALIFTRVRAAGAIRALFERGRPPADLVVTTSSGGAYSGVLLIDEGRVLGGVVRLAGSAPRLVSPQPSPALGAYPRPPVPRASPMFGELFHERRNRVEGDVEDDLEDDEPWRRR